MRFLMMSLFALWHRSIHWRRKRGSLEQLQDERWIMPKRTIDRDVSRILAKHKIHPNVVYELSVDQVILTMVNENLGISVVPNSLLLHAPSNLIRKNFIKHILDRLELHTNTVFIFLQEL